MTNLKSDIIEKSIYIQEILSPIAQEPISKDIDTIRGIITSKALAKIKKNFNLENSIYDKDSEAYLYKLDTAYLKVYTLTSKQNAHALEYCTNNHKQLSEYVYIELFGLSQYTKDTTKIQRSKQLDKLIENLLKQDTLKRKWFIIDTIDYAIDYDIPQVVENVILDYIEQNQSIVKTMFFPNCYIQNNDRQNIAPYLEKVCVYDKQKKDYLSKPLQRIEFTINTDKTYFKNTTYKNYQIIDLHSQFKDLEASQNQEDIQRLEFLKHRYKNAYKAYKLKQEAIKNDPLNLF